MSKFGTEASEIIDSVRMDIVALHELGIIDSSVLDEFDAITSPNRRSTDAEGKTPDQMRLNCPQRTPDPSQ